MAFGLDFRGHTCNNCVRNTQLVSARQMENETNTQLFAERLIGARNRKALTQQELADSVGASLRSVQNWEKGLHPPRGKHLRKLSAVLGVPTDYLLGDEPIELHEGPDTPLTGSVREKCHLYLDRVLNGIGDDEDRQRWLYVELQRQFPLDELGPAAGRSTSHHGFSSISPSQAAESVSAAERAVDYERRSRSRSRGAGEPSERKSAPSPGASPGAKGPPTPPKQVPE